MNATNNNEFDQLVAGVEISCDGGADDQDCANAPQWYMIFHDCNREILCEECARLMIVEVLATLHRYGRVGCSGCGGEWNHAAGFLTVRPI